MAVFIPFPQPLIDARFQRRYRRFFAAMRLADGTEVVAHCPNTGTLRSCLAPEAPALLHVSDDPRRKLPHGWKAIQVAGTWIGIDTLLPNRLVEALIRQGELPGVGEWTELQREPRLGAHHRSDLRLRGPVGDCWIEVKNVTLVEEGVARFPDAVTQRGQQHLRELTARVAAGERACVVFVIQREDGLRFRPADDIDPEFGQALRQAARAGVGVVAVRTTVSRDGVRPLGLAEVDL